MAQFNMGQCYILGQGVATDRAKAIYWYKKAAEQGYDNAQYMLSVLGVA